MLVEFTVKNYRSFRDEAVLSMEATGLSTLKSVLIPYGGLRILPSVATVSYTHLTLPTNREV